MPTQQTPKIRVVLYAPTDHYKKRLRTRRLIETAVTLGLAAAAAAVVVHYIY